MIVAAKNDIWAKSKFTAKDYVSDSLVLHWDGIEKDGYGLHTQGNNWVDLSGNNTPLTMSGYTFDDDGLVINGQTARAQVGNISNDVVSQLLSRLNNGYKNTLEVCMTFNSCSAGRVIFANTYDQNERTPLYFALNHPNYLAGGCFGCWNIRQVQAYPNNNETFTATGITGSDATYGYYNAQLKQEVAADPSKRIVSSNVLYFMPAITPAWSGVVFGKIHSIRVYAKELSAKEVKTNHAIDLARFNS